MARDGYYRFNANNTQEHVKRVLLEFSNQQGLSQDPAYQ